MNERANRYLAEEKIGKLMVKFSLPCILSFVVSSLYNIVDQIFIGQGVGFLGNGATNVVFPLVVVVFGCAIMFGDGGAAYLSISSGRGDTESSHKNVGNVIVTSLFTGTFLAVVFYLNMGSLLSLFGATPAILPYAVEYFSYILIGFPFFTLGIALNSIIRADGSPQFAMLAMIVGCVINVILDPIAIFVLGWGMMGAALATITGQIATVGMCLFYLRRAKTFRLKKHSFVPSISILKKTVPLGISSLLTQLSVVVVMAVINNALVKYGEASKYGADIPLTVLGIVMKVFQIVNSLVVGVAVGCQPLVGYNYGAGNFDRIREILRKMIVVVAIMGLFALLAFEFFPMQIISVFGNENELYNEFAVLSFRIFLSTIILTSIHKTMSIFLQALGKPLMALVLSLLRDFILLLPLIIVLPEFFGVEGILFSAPIADVLSVVVVVIVAKKIMKELKNAGEKHKIDLEEG